MNDNMNNMDIVNNIVTPDTTDPIDGSVEDVFKDDIHDIDTSIPLLTNQLNHSILPHPSPIYPIQSPVPTHQQHAYTHTHAHNLPTPPSSSTTHQPSSDMKFQPFQSPAMTNYTIHHTTCTPYVKNHPNSNNNGHSAVHSTNHTNTNTHMNIQSHEAPAIVQLTPVTSSSSSTSIPPHHTYITNPLYISLPIHLQASFEHEYTLYDRELIAKEKKTLDEFQNEVQKYKLQLQHETMQQHPTHSDDSEHVNVNEGQHINDAIIALDAEFQQERMKLQEKLDRNRYNKLQTYTHELLQKYDQLNHSQSNGINGNQQHTTQLYNNTRPSTSASVSLFNTVTPSSASSNKGNIKRSDEETAHGNSSTKSTIEERKATPHSQSHVNINGNDNVNVNDIQHTLDTFEKIVVDMERKSKQLRALLTTITQYAKQHEHCSTAVGTAVSGNASSSNKQKQSSRKLLRPSTAQQSNSKKGSNKLPASTEPPPRRNSLHQNQKPLSSISIRPATASHSSTRTPASKTPSSSRISASSTYSTSRPASAQKTHRQQHHLSPSRNTSTSAAPAATIPRTTSKLSYPSATQQQSSQQSTQHKLSTSELLAKADKHIQQYMGANTGNNTTKAGKSSSAGKARKGRTVDKKYASQPFDQEQAQSALQRYQLLLRATNADIDSQIDQIDRLQDGDRANVAVAGMRAVEELLNQYGGVVRK